MFLSYKAGPVASFHVVCNKISYHRLALRLSFLHTMDTKEQAIQTMSAQTTNTQGFFTEHTPRERLDLDMEKEDL